VCFPFETVSSFRHWCLPKAPRPCLAVQAPSYKAAMPSHPQSASNSSPHSVPIHFSFLFPSSRSASYLVTSIATVQFVLFLLTSLIPSRHPQHQDNQAKQTNLTYTTLTLHHHSPRGPTPLQHQTPELQLAVHWEHSPIMCYQVVELYSACRCLYYQHAVDRCAAYGRPGHRVTKRTILVGYACQDHSSQSSYGSYAQPPSYPDSGYQSGHSHKSSHRHR
jgi:hypothetical protein